MNYKFRGKKVSDNKWVEGDLQNALGGELLITVLEDTAPTYNNPCGDCVRMYYEVHPATVGLISSKPDSTGKMIAEGDKIAIKSIPSIHKVMFDGIKFYVSMSNGIDTIGLDKFRNSDLTITGTIHD